MGSLSEAYLALVSWWPVARGLDPVGVDVDESSLRPVPGGQQRAKSPAEHRDRDDSEGQVAALFGSRYPTGRGGGESSSHCQTVAG